MEDERPKITDPQEMNLIRKRLFEPPVFRPAPDYENEKDIQQRKKRTTNQAR